ncbi:hypothetical protein JTE90_007790 [Oedothorax gibbosus]|uniref:Uncharacterized protein n=1 Tax=Oedothorax gibbosus TaxID=931172 RepID=A0AAV6UEF0_9ARAC|nr:hypothetical protein JTE90_007790 [Oedothorax gibbosus]
MVSCEGLDDGRLFRLLKTRYHGCDSNPLLEILAIKESMMTEEILDILASKKHILEDAEVKEMLEIYDDCIRNSDGMPYKRAKLSTKSYSEFQKKFTDLVNNV